jgi:hypothetical protein
VIPRDERHALARYAGAKWQNEAPGIPQQLGFVTKARSNKPLQPTNAPTIVLYSKCRQVRSQLNARSLGRARSPVIRVFERARVKFRTAARYGRDEVRCTRAGCARVRALLPTRLRAIPQVDRHAPAPVLCAPARGN